MSERRRSSGGANLRSIRVKGAVGDAGWSSCRDSSPRADDFERQQCAADVVEDELAVAGASIHPEPSFGNGRDATSRRHATRPSASSIDGAVVVFELRVVLMKTGEGARGWRVGEIDLVEILIGERCEAALLGVAPCA